MSAYYYSLGMLLSQAAARDQITPESVRLLFLRKMIADEENQ